jgi:cell shape-determining protein MreC
MAGRGEPVVRSRRDLISDLVLVLVGVVALALPAWVIRAIEKSSAHAAGGVLSVLHSTKDDAESRTVLEAELVRLKEENLRLVEAIRRMDDFQALAGRLSLPKGAYVPALIIGERYEAGRWRYLLDAGAGQGVKPGAGVILGYAAFGVVVEITNSQSWVLRIDAQPVKIPAVIARTQAEGLLEATRDGLSLAYVRALQSGDRPQAAVDDLVLTSGRAGLFPAGVIIGRITGVGLSEDTLFHVIAVEPEVHYVRGDAVAVWKQVEVQDTARAGE